MKRRGRTIGGLLLLVLACAAWALLRHHPSGNALAQADRVIVEKRVHRLLLVRQGAVLKTYRVALGRGGAGDKEQAGDNRVPEGIYRIVGRNSHSAFHLALRVGYPTPEQVRQARLRGVNPGGDIMVHGIRNGLGWLGRLHQQVDWTKGCVAVTDEEMDEIWQAVPDGTIIEIRP